MNKIIIIQTLDNQLLLVNNKISNKQIYGNF